MQTGDLFTSASDISQSDTAVPKAALLQTSGAGALVQWRRYAFPLEWRAHFGAAQGAPLHLEIGFGDGRYTVRRAADAPDEAFIGLEISGASLLRGLKNIERHQVTNVRLLKANAHFAVQHLFAPRSLASVTVNFPDPWPKEKHEENRLLRAPFFELISSRLTPGGELRLATDHPAYLASSKEEARKTGLFDLRDAEPPAAVFETKYALKWKAQGKPLYYQIFTRRGASSTSGAQPEYPILERVDTMPHAILTGALPSHATFSKQVVPYASGHVILHEVARSLASAEMGERWLVRATIEEEHLRQQVLVTVRVRSGGELIVSLEPFGDPVVTNVVRGAVHAVTEWLLSLPADIRIKARSY